VYPGRSLPEYILHFAFLNSPQPYIIGERPMKSECIEIGVE
jgi:hypothetical protein